MFLTYGPQPFSARLTRFKRIGFLCLFQFGEKRGVVGFAVHAEINLAGDFFTTVEAIEEHMEVYRVTCNVYRSKDSRGACV